MSRNVKMGKITLRGPRSLVDVKLAQHGIQVALRALRSSTGLLALLVAFQTTSLAQVSYPVVAVRAPRHGDLKNTKWQEVVTSIEGEPGTSLVIIHKDGTEEVLVEGGVSTIHDPCPSLDGTEVYYARLHDLTDNVFPGSANPTASNRQGSDIYKINLLTRQETRLTHNEWTPNAAGASRPKPGVWNLGPCHLPGGKVMFSSTRNSFHAVKSTGTPCHQLFVMDEDGRNVELIGHLNLGAGLHPTLIANGEVIWSSWEDQGHRNHRLWGLWTIWPDGRQWGPIFSAVVPWNAFHFQSQLTDGRIVVTQYYNALNNGFGTIMALTQYPPPNLAGLLRFGSPNPALNQPIKTSLGMEQYSFSPYGLSNLTEFSHPLDRPSSKDSAGKLMGKVTHPSGAPNNDLLLVYSPGPASDKFIKTPYYQGQIAVLKGGVPVKHPSELTILKADPAYNYQQPRALVAWEAIYGTPPEYKPWYKNDGTEHAALPPGTPFGLVGTSSFYKRDSAPFVTVDQGNTGNWLVQGSDSGTYSDSEIYAVRIVQTEPSSIGAPKGWNNPIGERLRILAEVPLRKDPLILDPDGNPDTSFLVKIPADTPFTFQTLDAEGRVLNMAQTWHQLRPGETRHDCGGCHAHSQPGTDFASTYANTPAYSISTYFQSRTVRFEDLAPVIKAKCSGCHDANHTLNLATGSVYDALLKRVIPLRSRESLLIKKLYGAVDVDGMPMPPEGSPPLTDAEKRMFVEWVDLGASRGAGILTDDLRPTLTVQSPARNQVGPLATVRVGAIDTESGLKSLSVKANFPVNGREPDAELIDLFSVTDHVWTLALTPDTGSFPGGRLSVSATDIAGNVTSVVRDFTLLPAPVVPFATVREALSALWEKELGRPITEAELAYWEARFPGQG